MTFDAFLAHKTEEIQGKLIEKRQIFWWFHLVALQNASLWMSVLTSLFRLSCENIEWSMFQKWWIKNMFSFLHPVPITWLIGWRKHLVTSQTTPKWSVCALMSVVTTTDSSKIRSGFLYKSCMENASKHLQHDEEEDDLFMILYCYVFG